MKKDEVSKVATEIYAAYQMACTGKLLSARKAGDNIIINKMAYRLYADLSYADSQARKYFRKAARNCIMLGAEPWEFVAAQFARFEEFGKVLGKLLIPMPMHFASVGGQIRYIEYKNRLAEKTERGQAPKSQQQKWFREERRLKGLARALRVSEADVLAERPEEFPQEFLEDRGIWPVVKSLWYTRQ